MFVRNVLDAKGRRLVSIGPDAMVRDALSLFVEHNIGSLPVLDASGELVGIFTERDVLHGECRDLKSFHAQVIKEVMTADPITCNPDDMVQEVLGKMARHHVGALPVVDEGEVIGLVSMADLIRALLDQAEAENEHLAAYLYGPG